MSNVIKTSSHSYLQARHLPPSHLIRFPASSRSHPGPSAATTSPLLSHPSPFSKHSSTSNTSSHQRQHHGSQLNSLTASKIPNHQLSHLSTPTHTPNRCLDLPYPASCRTQQQCTTQHNGCASGSRKLTATGNGKAVVPSRPGGGGTT